MKFEVLFFATIKLRTGVSKAQIELAQDAPTVQDLLDEVVKIYPKIEASLSSLLVAVNKEFASKDQILRENDEIALFPPVSGG